ncbi:MAG: hypothetical protein ACNYNY_00120 [Candidatus Oxydemutatoraceae bacterium WSBS_2016_MAG_OTU14]
MNQDITTFEKKLCEVRDNFKEECSFFKTHEGCKYKNASTKLMFVGRATNGWDEKYNESTHKSENNCLEAWTAPEDRHPDGYSYHNSAFWQVAKAMTRKFLEMNEKDWNTKWSCHIVWSNLYRIAPKEKGNPSIALCKDQLDLCKDLLHAEIEELQPDKIICLTGYDNWAKGFFDIAHPPKVHSEKISCKGRFKNADYVVTAGHPQGKRMGTKEELASEIHEALKN